MRGCDNSKIHTSNKSILFICLLIMFITLQHLATLNHTTPNYTSLHLSTLHFLSFTLHYSPIWLNPSTFPMDLFHLTSCLPLCEVNNGYCYKRYTECPGQRYTKIHAYVIVPKSFMKFMFSTVYRVTVHCFPHIHVLNMVF